MKQNKTAKIFAIFALLGIVLSVVGTGILVLTSGNTAQTQTITSEELQRIIAESQLNVSTGATEVSSGE